MFFTSIWFSHILNSIDEKKNVCYEWQLNNEYFLFSKRLCRERKILFEIKFPAKQVTAVSFGGPDLDILYVITAATGDDQELAGRLFQVTGLGVRGHPGDKAKL